MKSRMKIKMGYVKSLWLVTMILFVTSCAKGVDDSETFSGGVKNVQLESPTIDENSFSTLANADGSESVKVTWPVIMGAGGYLFNLSIVDDPENPIVVVQDSVIDGCSVAFIKQEDTKYEVSIRTMGNEKLNNKEAEKATVCAYSTLVPATVIPQGQDIAEFVRANLQNSEKEQAFELIGGVEYTLNAVVDFGLNQITLRGDKVNHAKVVIGANGGIMTQNGLKVKFINFDCSAMSEQVGVVGLGTNPDPSLDIYGTGNYIITNPIILQECNFNGVNKSLIYSNKQPWAVKDFRISNCIVGLTNDDSEESVINFYPGAGNKGGIKDVKIMNSTFYNSYACSNTYFIRYSNSSNTQPKKMGFPDTTGSIVITNNTFYKTMTGKDFANNLPNTNTLSANVSNNIFYDCNRMNKVISSQAKKVTNNNYAFAVTKGLDNNDKKYATEEDPKFGASVTGDPSAVDFTPGNGTAAYANKAGDPRWYE